jgi:hypothetical protein
MDGKIHVYAGGEMNKEELTRLLEGFKKIAKELLLKDGALLPVCFLIDQDNDLAAIPLRFTDNREKDLMAQLIEEAFKLKKPKAVVFISESWLLVTEDIPFEEARRLIPSEHKDKTEIIALVGKSRQATVGMVVEIKRGKSVEFLDRLDCLGTTGISSRFLDNLWKNNS